MEAREIVMIILLLALILLFLFLKNKSNKKEMRREKEEREEREKKRKEGYKALSDDEKKLIYISAMKERSAFVLRTQEKYETKFHPFSPYEHKGVQNGKEEIIKDSIGYFKIPKGFNSIAAFFFTTDPDFMNLSAVTININGMVYRRFEGFSEYMSPHYYDVKAGDLITIEIEFSSNVDFTLKDFGVLLLSHKAD